MKKNDNSLNFKLGSHEYVELKNLLKLMDLVNSGGEAKYIIKEGGIYVNGEEELRPGKKLRAGDTVTFDNHTIIIEA
ncbi:MAG: RNA-binding S4 domain-containing protein [Saprospiraceae bacterium]|nr:RNA-binding S4 domain-containing protein [Saprospiraceae bacterium]